MTDIFSPLHPKLVHFPIALFLTALIFELLSRVTQQKLLREVSLLMYCFAAVLMPAVVISGLGEEARLSLNHPILTKHKSMGFLTMWFSLGSLPILWVFMKHIERFFPLVFLFFLLLVNLSCILSAHYGGKMVYEYAVGVNL